MPNLNCKKFWLFSSLFLSALASPAAHASGYDEECDDYACSTFFAPEVIRHPEESPFFLSNRLFYEHRYDVNSDELRNTASVNEDEWFAYFGQKLARAHLTWLLYKMPLADLGALRENLEGHAKPLSPRAESLRRFFVDYGAKERVLNSLRYLELAKNVEPIANRRSGEGEWDPGNEGRHRAEDLALATQLIAAVPAEFAHADAFVAARVKLQVLRLYFYTAQFPEAVRYFEAERASLAGGGSVRWRFMETAAGAYYKQKNYSLANYLYSLVFAHFAPEKRNAYFSFHPVEQADWQGSLALAKNSREKEVLWQLLGIYADGLAAIDQIYALDAKSDLLPLLLVRELNKAEDSWTANRNMALDPNGKPVSDANAVGVARLARLRALTEEGRVADLWLWRLAVGHLSALAGDAAAAHSYILAAAQGMPNVPVVRSQARMSLFLSRVLALHTVENSAEPYLAKELAWLRKVGPKNFRAENLRTWSQNALSGLYAAAGDGVRALLLKDNPQSAFYSDPARLDALLRFRQGTRSAFDVELLKIYPYTEQELHHLEALNALYRGDYSAARNFLRLAGPAVEGIALHADPFTARITDCHDCEIGSSPVITLAGFVERLMVLSVASQGSGEEAAKASLALGNALYSMSFYGNSRVVYSTEQANFQHSLWEEGNLDAYFNFNMDRVEAAYKRAAQLSRDPELQTKATFLLAKAEQNQYFNQLPGHHDEKIHPAPSFTTLKERFSQTQYFQEIVRDCGYFRKFLGR